MLISFKKIKVERFIKILAVLICSAILLGVFPVGGLSDLLTDITTTALAEEYNPEYGTYSETDGVLTAAPMENCGFRGWYDKTTGEEVSFTESFTVPDGADASNYYPVFYNFNLIENGGFEDYAVGTNMKTAVTGDEVWEGICDTELSGGNDWTKMAISADRAKSGTKSLAINAQYNTAYRSFSGLQTNTQYTVSFYYNIDASTSESANYLSYITVVSGGAEIDARSNYTGRYLALSEYNSSTGACASGEWKKASVTFYTDENTTVKLCLTYSSASGATLYLDDIALVKAEMEAPEYTNDDFSGGVQNWTVADETILTIASDGSGRLKGENITKYGWAQSRPIYLKKGYSYKFSLDLDMSQVTDIYVPNYDEDGNIIYQSDGVTPEWEIHKYDENGNPSLSANWINFSISNKAGVYGSSDAGTMFINDDGTEDVKLTANISNASSTHGGYTKTNTISSVGFGKSGVESGSKYEASRTLNCSNVLHSIGSLLGGGHSDSCYTITYAYDVDPNQVMTVTMSFTAPTSGEAFFNFRLNGRGVYYIDNFKVEETATDESDYIGVVLENDVIHTVGTAIRTTGKQGIRYKTEIDKRLLCSDKYFGIRAIEYGTVALRTDCLAGSELKIDTSYTYGSGSADSVKGVAYSADSAKDIRFSESDTCIHYTGVLMNIAEKYWNSDYTTRAYVKYVDANGTEGIFYVEPSDVAVYPISKLAYSSRDDQGQFAETEEVRDYLFKNIISKFTDKVVTVSNASEPVSTGFQGIRSTIYHATTFFPDSHGRTYTEAQAATEMDRLVDTKVDNVRTRFASQWMWSSSGWDWESTKMTAFYKWANMLQDRDISITVQAGWHLHDFIYYYDTFVDDTPVGYEEANAAGHSSIPEVNYMHGYTTDNAVMDDIYGEDSNAAAIEAAGRAVNLELDDSEFAHYSVAAARYGEWIKQGLLALKARGINNVEYVLPFTETGYARTGDPTYSYDEWTLMVIGLNNALETAGIKNNYKFIGPSQSIYAYQNREWSFVEYLYSKITGTEYEDMLDIVSMHQYTRPYTQLGYENTVYDPYGSYAMADANFNYYQQILENAGVSDMEFWCDEYFAHANDAKWWDDVGMQLTQFAAGLTAGINTGVDRFLTWQMFDTLWDSEATHGTADVDRSGEFIGGVHAVGTCPSLVFADGKDCPNGSSCDCHRYSYSSYVPRVTYYGINLIGKYMNNENASVYGTSVLNNDGLTDGGLYVSAIKNDMGKTVILVVNTENTINSVDIELEENHFAEFKRYTYNPEEITPTAEALSISSDATISCDNSTSFSDVISPRSFVIYVAGSTFVGDDVDMEMPQ